jgi:hypothetical protein
MKLLDITSIEMELPKDFAAKLTCGEYSTFITEHAKKNKKLKFVIYIYEEEE